MYTYEKFKQEMIKKLQENVGKTVKVSLLEIFKNNDTQKTVISLSRENEKFTPNIHVADLYERYEEGESVEAIVEDLLYVYENKEDMELTEIFEKWEEAKKYITVAAINREWNENFLSHVVYKNFLDLSIICKCVFMKKENLRASYNVTYELLKQWGITEEELWLTALGNLEKEKMVIKELSVMMEMITGEKNECDSPLYVITCQDLKDGAKAMLRTDCFKALSNRVESDLYIFPSSTNELLCVSADENLEIEYMRTMVREINETQVSEEERLSNEVYFYSREKDEVSIA